MTSDTKRRGRPSRAYRSTIDGKEVHGLYRLPGSNRWRIVATGERFTEADERRAIQRFRDWEAQGTVAVPITVEAVYPAGVSDRIRYEHGQTLSTEFWKWLRELLISQPEFVAKNTGLPEVAGLRHLEIPREPLQLSAVWDAYAIHNGGKPATKAATKRTWDHFVHQTEAATMADLTTERLMAYRAKTEAEVPSPGTRKLYYSKVKTVLAFGLKVGLDNTQIRAALDRAKVLWTAQRTPAAKPAPISKEDFHALLAATETYPWQVWRAWLLVGLNLAMHIGEVCELRWNEIDLEKKTYCSIRGKTEAHRIPRAATLWPETVAALKALPRKPEYVFTSHYGTKYNRNKRVNSFAEFRDAAKLPHITFDTLRDGAYTAAVRNCEEKLARLLAGHRSPGLQDSYVLRNPAIVKPACDAVRRIYGPFPRPKD